MLKERRVRCREWSTTSRGPPEVQGWRRWLARAAAEGDVSQGSCESKAAAAEVNHLTVSEAPRLLGGQRPGIIELLVKQLLKL